MNLTIEEHIWLNTERVCSARHLAEVSGLSDEEIDALIANGFILPIDEQAEQQSFYLDCQVTAATARKLRDDFELDQNGLMLALTLMRRIQALEEQLKAAQAGQTVLICGDYPDEFGSGAD